MEDTDTEETESQILQRTLTEPSVVIKPFHHIHSCYDGIWKVPYFSCSITDRHDQFAWIRPKADRKTLVESASRYQAQQLQKLLLQKEREIRLITKQLLKSNKENVTLLKELEGYRGKNYYELYQENIVLKEQVKRTTKENVILTGKIRQLDNRSHKKLSAARPKTAI